MVRDWREMRAFVKFLVQALDSAADVVITFAENNPTFIVLGVLALLTKYILAFIE